MNLKELKELKNLCKELEIITFRDFREFKYEICATDENVLSALKRYIKEIREVQKNDKVEFKSERD